ncbi:MAG: hypothetical protein A2007_04945 [Verrucomicrobia bacterium GWC2_42_7]|nr:MAG: hypothetical protein A2007_04945 [Verrucomicrobia bacterium GWC2_42_7]
MGLYSMLQLSNYNSFSLAEEKSIDFTEATFAFLWKAGKPFFPREKKGFRNFSPLFCSMLYCPEPSPFQKRAWEKHFWGTIGFPH